MALKTVQYFVPVITVIIILIIAKTLNNMFSIDVYDCGGDDRDDKQ